MFKNKNLLIVAIIAVISTLAYTIIIPIQYSYAQVFHLTDFEIGLLFAVFAFFSFISSPLIGRLSDKYGRRPLLIISLAGTTLSLLMTAFAPNAIFLFLARALDGITAGNYPVVAAVIVDSTDETNRAKGFGIIGASWSAGFVLGPAVAGMPHYGSLLSSLPKDLFGRYWTMKGYRVRRVWGWDGHGLPIENKVEAKLNITRKKRHRGKDWRC